MCITCGARGSVRWRPASAPAGFDAARSSTIVVGWDEVARPVAKAATRVDRSGMRSPFCFLLLEGNRCPMGGLAIPLLWAQAVGGEPTSAAGAGSGRRARQSGRDGLARISPLVLGADALLSSGRAQPGRALAVPVWDCRAPGRCHVAPGSADGPQAARRSAGSCQPGSAGQPESLACGTAGRRRHHGHRHGVDGKPDPRLPGRQGGQGEGGAHPADPVEGPGRAGAWSKGSWQPRRRCATWQDWATTCLCSSSRSTSSSGPHRA